MTRSYWINYPRDFANEYTVAVASTKEAAANYEAEDYERIDRARALRQLGYRGDAATEAYVSAQYDGGSVDALELARAIRVGDCSAIAREAAHYVAQEAYTATLLGRM